MAKGVRFIRSIGKGHIHRDALVEPQHGTRQGDTVTPRVIQRHKQVIPPRFGREIRIADPRAKAAKAAHERTSRTGFLGFGLIFFGRNILGHTTL